MKKFLFEHIGGNSFKLVRENSSDITKLSLELPGDKPIRMAPSSWNENGGVIVYSDSSGRVFITPATNEARSFFQNGYRQDKNVGVPNSNQKEYWGQNDALWNKWKQIYYAATRK